MREKRKRKRKAPQARLPANAIVPPQNLDKGLDNLFALCRVHLGLRRLAVIFVVAVILVVVVVRLLDLAIHIHLVAAVLGPVAIVAVALSLAGRRNDMAVLAGIAVGYLDAISIFGRGLRHFGSMPLSVRRGAVLAAPPSRYAVVEGLTFGATPKAFRQGRAGRASTSNSRGAMKRRACKSPRAAAGDDDGKISADFQAAAGWNAVVEPAEEECVLDRQVLSLGPRIALRPSREKSKIART